LIKEYNSGGLKCIQYAGFRVQNLFNTKRESGEEEPFFILKRTNSGFEMVKNPYRDAHIKRIDEGIKDILNLAWITEGGYEFKDIRGELLFKIKIGDKIIDLLGQLHEFFTKQ